MERTLNQSFIVQLCIFSSHMAMLVCFLNEHVVGSRVLCRGFVDWHIVKHFLIMLFASGTSVNRVC